MSRTTLKKHIARKRRIRSRVSGTVERPRVSVFRSNKFIYAQIINDEKGVTLAHAKGKDAAKVGQELGEKALKAKVKKLVFDRGGYKYHGNVKKVADGLREKGLDL
ncbi:MAG TPA: 50S ribosomal protein L18 [Patescibacteria group bacterium]